VTSNAANDAGPQTAGDSAGFEHGDEAIDVRARRLGALLFSAIAVAMAVDLFVDAAGGPWVLHLLTELSIIVLAICGALFQRAQFMRERRLATELRSGLVAARADALHFREQSQAWARGLSEAIDAQLEAWSCSPAEREVALMLLKGLALKEIAQLRGTSERTARQQSLSLYKKAQVAGRAELSAFFLEDLLPPRSA
jgi:DNA-binding CsgD family transcriptional regulator